MQKRKNNDDLQFEVEAELMAGEDLLWVGQPDPLQVALALRHLWPMLFGLLWLGFVGFIFFGFSFASFGNMGGRAGIFSVLPLIFIAVGLWPVSLPLREYISATRTVYALTPRRAIIVSGLFSRTVQSYSPNQMQLVKTRVHGNGTGDIIFQLEERSRSSGSHGRRYYTVEIGFFGIHNPREVEALMLELFTANHQDLVKQKRK